MRPEIYALLLSLAAGLSTMIGAVVIFFTKGKSERVLAIALGFAAGVMVSVSLVDLYVESHEEFEAASGSGALGVLFAVVAMAIGMALAAGLDRILPHAHGHGDEHEHDHDHDHGADAGLMRVGIVSAVAIALHNLPEGVAIFMTGYEDAALGVTVALAIALHNIPVGVTVALPIYCATGKRGKALGYTLLSGIFEPVGALIACLLLRHFVTSAFMGAVYGGIAGIMLYVAVAELIPSSHRYGHDKAATVAALAGFLIMPLSAMLH